MDFYGWVWANSRQMEVQMKAICEGRQTRNDVVQQNLEQYRAVFNRTMQQMNVLKAVSRAGRDPHGGEAVANMEPQAIRKYIVDGSG